VNQQHQPARRATDNQTIEEQLAAFLRGEGGYPGCSDPWLTIDKYGRFNHGPAARAAVADMALARGRRGVADSGTTPFSGRVALRDLYEQLLGAVVYAFQANAEEAAAGPEDPGIGFLAGALLETLLSLEEQIDNRRMQFGDALRPLLLPDEAARIPDRDYYVVTGSRWRGCSPPSA
jgi:hypothetical protein